MVETPKILSLKMEELTNKSGEYAKHFEFILFYIFFCFSLQNETSSEPIVEQKLMKKRLGGRVL
jgi:hypothetical protein